MFLQILFAAVAISNVPPSTVPESTVPESTVPAAVVSTTTVPESNLDRFSAWAEARATKTAFPAGRVAFRAPVDPALLQISDPAEVGNLVERAKSLHGNGRTVYFCYSPYRGELEHYQFDAVLEAIETLAAECDGFAPAFRRSGQHYLAINKNLAAQFAVAARRGNPDIVLLGEFYIGDLNRGMVRWSSGVFTFPGCAALLGVNLPQGNRVSIYRTLKSAGVLNIPLIEVLRVGMPAEKRYRYHLYIDLDNDN